MWHPGHPDRLSLYGWTAVTWLFVAFAAAVVALWLT